MNLSLKKHRFHEIFDN